MTSLQFHRDEYARRSIPPEHPSAGTSDDVESFISVLHEILGDTFDTKGFYNSFPKILNEFLKTISSDISFYYWTGHKHRFSNIPLALFNQTSLKGKKRLDIIKPSRRDDPDVFCARSADLTIRNSTTVRTKFHKFEETRHCQYHLIQIKIYKTVISAFSSSPIVPFSLKNVIRQFYLRFWL